MLHPATDTGQVRVPLDTGSGSQWEANLQFGRGVFNAQRVVGPGPVGVRVAEPLAVLTAVLGRLF